MKNAFKFGFLALAITLSVSACGGDAKTESTGDSTVVDSGAVSTIDTAATDSLATDTTLADTTTKM